MSNSILEMKQCEGECGALVRDGRYCEECEHLMRMYAPLEPPVTLVKGRLEWPDLDREDVGVVPMPRWKEGIALFVLCAGALLDVVLTWRAVVYVWRMLAR